MFNAERLLGSLVTTALSKGLRSAGRQVGRSGGLTRLARRTLGVNKATIGMGLLGLAVGAFEHFSRKSQASTSPQTPGQTPRQTPTAPLPSPSTSGSSLSWAPPPLPVESAPEAPHVSEKDAILLIRAMIAAANADHAIDNEERQRILAKIDEQGCSQEERDFVLRELENPADIGSLLGQIKDPQLAEQVYIASLLAIEVDSDAESNYLKRLAKGLRLDSAVVAKWHQEFKILEDSSL